MTTHKERMLMALNHEQPDHVPMDLGGRQTTLSILAYENLKRHLGLANLPTQVMAHAWQTCFIDESILEKFDIDTRHIRPARKVNKTIGEHLSSDGSDGTFVDEWGVKRQIVVGAPVHQELANIIGADGYSDDAPSAVTLLRKFV